MAALGNQYGTINGAFNGAINGTIEPRVSVMPLTPPA
jgi:hypothetical protein